MIHHYVQQYSSPILMILCLPEQSIPKPITGKNSKITMTGFQGLANIFVKGFAAHLVSVTTILLCYCNSNRQNVNKWVWVPFNKT